MLKPVMLASITPDQLGAMIPIVAIVMGVGFGMLKLYLDHKKRREMFALYHQERMAAIDKGIELPPLPDEFFAKEERNNTPRSGHGQLLRGMVLLFAGVVITLSLYKEEPEHWMWGLIPIAMGLAFLVYYFAVGRKLALLMEEERRATLAEAKTRAKN